MPASQRSVAWLLLVTSAAAVLLTGLVSTLGVVSTFDVRLATIPTGLWTRAALAATLTIASLGVRALRWVFLLRRSGVRIPIRDAYIGYLSGFSLLVAPLLVGETAVRAYVFRIRTRVPPARTIQVNIWERICDAIALLIVATVIEPAWFITTVTLLAAGVVPRATRTWSVATTASVVAWALPALGLWMLWNHFAAVDATVAAHTFATSTLTLSPAGVITTGSQLLDKVQRSGAEGPQAVAIIILARVATIGVSTALGLVMFLVHLATVGKRDSADARGQDHFDDIAEAYDAQIPADRRDALLARKTALMQQMLATTDQRGLDVGCGQGWYVARMRELGFDVEGIDMSAGQLTLAARHLGSPSLIRLGSALAIPAADASYHFVYTINVLHHLPTVDDQQRAFRELARVLKPGGWLFVHEINTRNPLFRFYMGYVFPTLNCIDEGVERWLLPHRLGSYTELPVRAIRYFTFLPEFLPQPIVRLLSPIERWLERSPAAPYSAHYMAVLQKPS